jgi:hypothetical protein
MPNICGVITKRVSAPRCHCATIVSRDVVDARRGGLIASLATETVHHQRALAAEGAEGSRENEAVPRIEHAAHLARGTGGVGERAEHVEDRGYPERAPRAHHMLHRGVQCGREQKADPDLVDAAPDHARVGVDAHAECLEHVRAPAAAARGTIAVLGHRHAACGHHDRDRGRDVATRDAAATGAARVEQGRTRGRHARDRLAHGRGRAGDLVGRLALAREPHEQRPDLRWLTRTRHQLAKHLGDLVARQIVTPLQSRNSGLDRAHLPPCCARKLPSR